MRKNIVFSLVLVFVLMGVLGLAFRIQRVEASGTIYIKADGSVEGTTYIVSGDNVTYAFTANINDSIVVERNNIIVDGNGHTLNGSWSLMYGFNLTSVSSVTTKNVNIVEFGYAMWLEGASQCVISNNTCTNNEGGIWLVSSTENIVSDNTIKGSVEAVALDSSSGNTITRNNMTDNHYSVYAINNSTGNTISENNIKASSTSGIYLNGSPNNVISGNNVKDSPQEHICLLFSSNNTIVGNTVTNSTADVGIYAYGCSLNSFFGNNITSNANSGIRFEWSSDSTIYENNISENIHGIYLLWSSNITISKNDITTNNQIGIAIDFSNNNTINGNNIMTNKGYGVDFNSASNKFFHNNFINNTVQVRAPTYNNTWDNGYPSGGNYWSDYTGVDSNRDGIGDSWYNITQNNSDHYPLMGMFHSFNTTLGKSVNVISNSTIESFQYFESNSTIIIHVSNMTASQTNGFCRISIPYEVMAEPFTVTIDGANPTYWNYTLYDNGTHRWIYFAYEHSTLEIIIVPEFPSFLMLPLFVAATLLAVIISRRIRISSKIRNH